MGTNKSAKGGSKTPMITTPKPIAKPIKLPTTTPTSPPPATTEAAYTEYLAEAQALPASSVKPFLGNASTVYANVVLGVKNVLAQQTALLTAMPGTNIATIESLPNLALALLFADLQAERGSTKNLTLQANLKEARALRTVILSSAQSLAVAGALNPLAVEQIQKGTGSRDTAKDLTALAALFTANASAVAGKSPVTAAQLARAAVLGTTLQSQLSAPGIRKTPSEARAAAADIRNRFWTLVTQSYTDLWVAGAVLFKEEGVSKMVPALLSRAVVVTAAKKAATAAKAVTKATAKATKAATRAANVKPKPVKKAKKKK